MLSRYYSICFTTQLLHPILQRAVDKLTPKEQHSTASITQLHIAASIWGRDGDKGVIANGRIKTRSKMANCVGQL